MPKNIFKKLFTALKWLLYTHLITAVNTIHTAIKYHLYIIETFKTMK